MRKDKSKAFQYLLDTETDVNIRNDDKAICYGDNGKTALHVAAQIGKIDIVKLLVKNGANIEKTTRGMFYKETAIDLAKGRKNEDVVKYLKTQGAIDRIERDEESSDSESDVSDESLSGPSQCKKRKIDMSSDPETSESEHESDTAITISRKTPENVSHCINIENECVSSSESHSNSSVQTDHQEEKEPNKQHEEEIATNSEQEIGVMFKSMTNFLTRKDYSFESKMFCVSAIDSMISRNMDTYKHIATKEVVNELARLFSKKVSEVGEEPNSSDGSGLEFFGLGHAQ